MTMTTKGVSIPKRNDLYSVYTRLVRIRTIETTNKCRRTNRRKARLSMDKYCLYLEQIQRPQIMFLSFKQEIQIADDLCLIIVQFVID
jgi:hypothetical protein